MRKRVLAIAAVLVCILLLCVGCAPSASSPPPYPPYAENVCSMLGQDMKTVLEKIGLSTEDFVYEHSSYYYKETVEFCGYAFRMRITPWRSTNLVQSISYVLEYKGEPENAAKAIIEIREKMITGDGLIRPNSSNKDQKMPLEAVTAEELIEYFTNREWSASLGWVLTTELEAVSAEIMEAKVAPTCVSARYLVNYPNAGEEATDGNGTVCIILDYGLTTDSLSGAFD